MTTATYRFFYRQSARSAGIGFMIGPPILSAALVFAFLRFVNPPIILKCILLIFWLLLAGSFFVIGLRRVIYGGEWGCFIDNQYMTWVYPHHMGKQDQQVAVTDIQKFVIQIDRDAGKEQHYSFFIETAAGRLSIDNDCFGRIKKLGRALLQVNPEIQLEILNEGHPQPWMPDQAPWWLI